MKFQFEEADIEAIARRVADLLRPIILNSRKPEQDNDIVFTVETLAEFLKVDRSWIYKQIGFKKIPYFKAGKYVRFRKKTLINGWKAKPKNLFLILK